MVELCIDYAFGLRRKSNLSDVCCILLKMVKYWKEIHASKSSVKEKNDASSQSVVWKNWQKLLDFDKYCYFIALSNIVIERGQATYFHGITNSLRWCNRWFDFPFWYSHIRRWINVDVWLWTVVFLSVIYLYETENWLSSLPFLFKCNFFQYCDYTILFEMISLSVSYLRYVVINGAHRFLRYFSLLFLWTHTCFLFFNVSFGLSLILLKLCTENLSWFLETLCLDLILNYSTPLRLQTTCTSPH